MNGLNLGCGIRPIPGWINLDDSDDPRVDVRCDLNGGVLPFDDASFDRIIANHVLEHLLHWEPIVIECYRVLRPGGMLEIRVPGFEEGFHSPYHLRHFTRKTFSMKYNYFLQDDAEAKKGHGYQPKCNFELYDFHVLYDGWGIWHVKKYLEKDIRQNIIPRIAWSPFPHLIDKEYEWILRKSK